jgi:hypothetical protein
VCLIVILPVLLQKQNSFPSRDGNSAPRTDNFADVSRIILSCIHRTELTLIDAFSHGFFYRVKAHVYVLYSLPAGGASYFILYKKEKECFTKIRKVFIH